MLISSALRELWAGLTQERIAELLTAAGLPTRQTTVSAWLRGRTMSHHTMNFVEQAAGKPRGWIVSRAGFVDPVAVAVELRLIKKPRGS